MQIFFSFKLFCSARYLLTEIQLKRPLKNFMSPSVCSLPVRAWSCFPKYAVLLQDLSVILLFYKLVVCGTGKRIIFPFFALSLIESDLRSLITLAFFFCLTWTALSLPFPLLMSYKNSNAFALHCPSTNKRFQNKKIIFINLEFFQFFIDVLTLLCKNVSNLNYFMKGQAIKVKKYG